MGEVWRKGARAVDRCFTAGLLPGDPRVSMQDSRLIKAMLEEGQPVTTPTAHEPHDDRRLAKLAIAYQKQREWNRSVKGALYRDMAAGFRREDVEFTKKLNELQERLRHDVNVRSEVDRWTSEEVLWRGAPARFHAERLASALIMRRDPEKAGECLCVLIRSLSSQATQAWNHCWVLPAVYQVRGEGMALVAVTDTKEMVPGTMRVIEGTRGIVVAVMEGGSGSAGYAWLKVTRCWQLGTQ